MLRTGATQDKRIIKVKTPLGKDVLLLHHMQGTEELGKLFQFELEMLSSQHDIKFKSILGQNVTIEYELPKGGKRYFNGFVSEFHHIGEQGEYVEYQMQLRPWLWFLTRTADCKIFQNLTVPEIIKKVFKDNGFTDFEDRLNGSYRQWVYCVQYRETDFNFVSRLMEQEGIYYYFQHEDGKHIAILSDSISAHSIYPDYGVIPFRPPSSPIHDEHISNWQIMKEIQPGRYVLNEYDFTAPKADKKVDRIITKDHEKSDLEIYDYPGEYKERSDGDNYAQIRIDELHADYEIVQGEGDAGGLATGCLFRLTDHPRNDQAREYLVTTANYEATAEEFESGAGGGGGEAYYLCQFSAIDSGDQFRPARTTSKPIVQGPQTAVVVGPPGEEIYTDEKGYGQIKVQFHWDRYGKKDENSSCWIRIAESWAGSNWGSIHIPRIGQEVVVEFLEGDPDRPIVTGRVYNADNMPPYSLPGNKTQSGIKSRSSKGGTKQNFNEIRFEDKKGKEEVYVHAERNLRTVVEVDESRNVGHNRQTTIGNDENINVKQHRTVHIDNGHETIVIQTGNHTMDVNTGHHTVNVIKGNQELNVKGGHATLKVKSGNRDVKVPAGRYQLSAGKSIELVCGASSIKLEASGKISINGVNLESIASAINEIKGALVKINC